MLFKSVSVTSHKKWHLGEEPGGSTTLLCLQPTQTAAWGGCFKANCSQSIKQRDKLEAAFSWPWQLADGLLRSGSPYLLAVPSRCHFVETLHSWSQRKRTWRWCSFHQQMENTFRVYPEVNKSKGVADPGSLQLESFTVVFGNQALCSHNTALSLGLSIYWVLPAKPKQKMILIHELFSNR